MRLVMVLFKCDDVGCDRIEEMLVPVVHHNIGHDRVVAGTVMPKGWGPTHVSGRNTDADTFCPDHAHDRWRSK